jgi:hypothetical protein
MLSSLFTESNIKGSKIATFTSVSCCFSHQGKASVLSSILSLLTMLSAVISVAGVTGFCFLVNQDQMFFLGLADALPTASAS